ncbi:MAG: serine acetyltransferase [Nannocystaceae bacterium]|jgi:serine O-acetyltransferase
MTSRPLAVETAKPDDVASAPTQPRPSHWDALRTDYAIHGRTLANPALWALAVYRFGRWSLEQRNPATRWASSKLYGALAAASRAVTGVHLDRTCEVGRALHLIHCEAPISINPRCTIGDRVGIMHNVTIGDTPDGGVPRIGNDVFIGVGAVILGAVTIGDGAQIAANSLVIADVPPDHVAVGVPARVYPAIGAKPKAKVSARGPGGSTGR